MSLSRLQQLKRACCHVVCGTHRGTGYLVAPDWVATCAHVVRAASTGEDIEVRFGERPLAAVVIACDEQADCALLKVADAVVDRTPLPLALGARAREPWTAYGFAQRVVAAGIQGLMLSGEIRDPGAIDESGAPMLVLYCDEAAAGMGARVQGCSGSPVLIAGAVVGHLRRISPEDTEDLSPRAEYGHIFACPAERVAALRPRELPLLSSPSQPLDSPSARAAPGSSNAAIQSLTARVAGTGGTYGARLSNLFSEYLEAEGGQPVPFGGRQDELRELYNWLDDPERPSRLLLLAPAGRGKTALLIRWSAQLLHWDDLYVLMYPVSARFSTNLASVTFGALASALASLHDEAAPSITCSSDVTRALVTMYLQRPLPAGRRLLVILDGVDEAADWHVAADLVPWNLPPGVKVLVAAREQAAEAARTDWLHELAWVLPRDAECMTLSQLRLADVAELVASTGMTCGLPAPPADYGTHLHRLSEGDPLVLQLYLKDLLRGWQSGEQRAWVELPANIPGLGGYFAAWWQSQRRLWGCRQPLKERAAQAVLNLLSCALGPLSKADLLRLAPAEAALTSWALGEVLDDLRRFVIGDDYARGYVFSHPRLAAWFYELMSVHERRIWEERYLSHGKQLLAAVQEGGALPERLSNYFIEHYGAHLERAKVRLEEYRPLLSSAWYKTRQTHDPTLAGFVHDVDRAWRAAATPLEDGTTPVYFSDELRCALILAGVASISRDVTPAVLGALVEKRVWSPTQALLFARRWRPSPGPLAALAPQLNLAAVLQALAPRLSDEQILEVLSWGCNSASSYEAVGILRALLPYLRGSLFDVAVARALAIGLDHRRAEALRMLLTGAPAAQRSSLAAAALAATREIADDAARASALTELIPELPSEYLETAREIIDGLRRRPWYPSAPLGRLALRLSEPARSQAQRAALLPLLAAMKDKTLALDWHIPRRLAEVVAFLPASLLRVARRAIKAVGNEALKSELLDVLSAASSAKPSVPLNSMAMAALVCETGPYDPALHQLGRQIANAAQLPVEQRRTLWQRVRTITDIGDRALCMSRLLPYLPEPEQGMQELLAELPSICRDADPRQRPLILETLAPHLPADALSQVLVDLHLIDDAPQRLAAVAALLPYVGMPQRTELVSASLAAVLCIPDGEARIRAALSLLPCASAQQLQGTLRWLLPAIQTLSSYRREEGYSGDGLHISLVPGLGEAEAKFELPTIRSELLCQLIPYLPGALRIPLLRDLLTLEAPGLELKGWPEQTGWSLEQTTLVSRIEILAPYIPVDMQAETLATIDALPYVPSRVTALAAMSPFVPHLEGVLAEAVAAVRVQGEESFHLESHLADVVKLLPDIPLRSQLASEIATSLALVSEPSWADILAPIAAHLSDQDKTRLWALIEEFGFGQERAESMAALAPHMPTPEKPRAIQAAIDSLRALPDILEDPGEVPPDFEGGYLREQARLFRSSRQGLSALAAHLSDEMLSEQILQGLDFEPELVLPALARAVAARSQQTGHTIYHQALRALADAPRDVMLTAVRHLAPLIAAHGGAEEAARCARVILDLHDKTPAC